MHEQQHQRRQHIAERSSAADQRARGSLHDAGHYTAIAAVSDAGSALQLSVCRCGCGCWVPGTTQVLLLLLYAPQLQSRRLSRPAPDPAQASLPLRL